VELFASSNHIDPLGVPGNITSVRATGVSNGDSRTLRFSPVGSTNFYVTFPDYQGQTGQYNFTVTNKQGQTDSQLSHILDHPTALPISQNLKVSDFGLTPTLSFDSVAGANRYDLEIIDNNLKQLFISPTSLSPSLNVPSGLLQYNTTYFLSARADQFDFSEPFTGVSRLENRSVNYFGFRAFPAVTDAPDIRVFPSGPLGDLGNFITNEAVKFGETVYNQFKAAFQGVEALVIGGDLNNKTKFEAGSLALGSASKIADIATTVTGGGGVLVKGLAIVVDLAADYLLDHLPGTVKNMVQNAKGFFDSYIAANSATTLTTFWSAVLTGTSFILQDASNVLQRMALDPPDANFNHVVQPDLVHISGLSAPGISSDRLAFATSLFNAYADTTEYLELSRISAERYLAALTPSDSVFAGQQLLAFLDYLNTYNSSAILAALLTQELIERMLVDGVPDAQYDPQLVADFQQQLRTSGLPTDVANVLTGMGLSESELPGVANAVLAFDPNSLEGALYDSERNVSNILLANTTNAAVPEANSLISPAGRTDGAGHPRSETSTLLLEGRQDGSL
jgi:hypothetical protein